MLLGNAQVFIIRTINIYVLNFNKRNNGEVLVLANIYLNEHCTLTMVHEPLV